MAGTDPQHRIVPFPPLQHLTIDWLEIEHHKHTMHALLSFDVTDARRAIREYRERTGRPLSLTAFMTYCFARAVDAEKAMQACRLGHRRLVLFDDVDVGIMVEREVGGVKLPAPHVIRMANAKSVEEIQEEIQAAKGERWTGTFPSPLRAIFPYGLSLWLALPAVLRRSVWFWMLHNPYRRKRMMGTVGLTSVGMFGRGAGWGIAPMAHPLTLVVGGLDRRPGLVGDRIEPREYLCLTLTLDHDVIDGAPAARFAERLKELTEGAAGLDPEVRESEPMNEVVGL